MSRAIVIAAGLAALAAGCGDRGLKSEDTSGRGQLGADAPSASTQRHVSDLDLAGLALPGVDGAPAAARDAGPAASPEERRRLRETLDAALAENRLDEAIATADVLEVLFPDDPEILELRGRALDRQGDAVGSARDLARCCELGRAACCAGRPR
jgi:hypothetical protein